MTGRSWIRQAWLFLEHGGELPADVTARIAAADEASLARWAMRLLTVRTAADVLDTNGEGRGAASPSSRKSAARKRA